MLAEPKLDPTLSQISQLDLSTLSFPIILHSQLHIGATSGFLLPHILATMFCSFPIPAMLATCSALPIFCEFITLIIFVKKHEVWRALLRNPSQAPAVSSSVGQNILFSTPFSKPG
jgi:hypothetical protein